MKYKKLLEFIAEKVEIDTSDLSLVEKLFEPVTYSKNNLLEEENKIAKYLYFINSGFIRLFYYQDGIQITSHINCPSGFITSFNSFITKTISHQNLECITTCDLLRISKNDLDLLFQHSPKWAEFGRVIYDESLFYNEQRTKDIITLCAEERYRKLLTNQPEIIQNVPLQYIASFIGIKPESLS
ncbi:Crp/Fnr family transcriptional regulator [Flavobacterium collinsii]|uniref:cAMP-binding proteins - catabolite gene activator and regulatory subunit of cAMP-dependent protein kinases n=1 Tax=Flavobacterium collinsii TaxID=1114861 RepID=A0A9W4TK57_9FLAO|nr:cyclic nucleotide-binding domain-containing protein [Flavobacterium collinsii]CAI2768665.1 cAMP-binding proteins - catabolite gene activator and regulatory subunit of cAMP-dependent protein kinases [Flavobacterium collinsii]